MPTKTTSTIPLDTSATGPYPPSFVDRFMDWVERLPAPYWLTYLGLFILQGLMTHVLAWMAGSTPVFTFRPILLSYAVWLWGPLAIMTYLGSVSLEALSSFSLLLDVDEEKLDRLKYEFRVMPARSVILNGVLWFMIFLVISYATRDIYVVLDLGAFLTVVVFLQGLISFSVGSAIYYYSLRQLRLVNHTVKMVEQFSLFRIDPVYAFSRLTSQIGVSWMLLLSLTLLIIPMELVEGVSYLAMLALQVVLATAAFVLPLWFVHRRLVSEKRRLLAQLNRRVEVTFGQLHRYVDGNELGGVDQLNSAMTALGAERDVLNAIPTWPWRRGTLAGFMSVIALPIILSLIQRVLERWLGG